MIDNKFRIITSPKNKNYDELLFKNRAYEPLDATVGSDNNECYWCGLSVLVRGLGNYYIMAVLVYNWLLGCVLINLCNLFFNLRQS